MKNEMLVSAILAVVVSVLLTNFLPSFLDGPDMVIISAYSTRGTSVDFPIIYAIELYNQGNKVGQMCKVFLDPDTNDQNKGKWSGVFSVAPQQNYKFTFNEFPYKYDKIGNYTYSVSVKCENNSETEPQRYGIDPK